MLLISNGFHFTLKSEMLPRAFTEKDNDFTYKRNMKRLLQWKLQASLNRIVNKGSMLWPLETKFPPIVYFFSFLFQTCLGLDMWEGKPRLWMSATKAMKFYSCTYIQVTSWIQGYSLERFIPKNISSFSHLTNTKKSSSFLSEVLSKNIFACDHWFLHFPIQSSGSHG